MIVYTIFHYICGEIQFKPPGIDATDHEMTKTVTVLAVKLT